jgi:Cu-Zn family superoxide dismutase
MNNEYQQQNISCRNCPYYRGDSSALDAVKKAVLKIRIAVAAFKGSSLAPNIKGRVIFRDVPGGTQVCVNVTGLPQYRPASEGVPQIGPHGFHIHEFSNCTEGDPKNPFMAAGGHWNPTKQPHGNHAGDFPVLFSNGGAARMCFFTNKFRVSDIIGKTVIIHEGPDDYKSQPAGNAGKRIACGVIKGYPMIKR